MPAVLANGRVACSGSAVSHEDSNRSLPKPPSPEDSKGTCASQKVGVSTFDSNVDVCKPPEGRQVGLTLLLVTKAQIPELKCPHSNLFFQLHVSKYLKYRLGYLLCEDPLEG